MASSYLMPNVIKNDFKCIVVRRKLGTVNGSPVDVIDFDTLYDTNVSNAECFIDETGDIGIGLYTRDNPPSWEEFTTYGCTCAVIQDQVNKSETGTMVTMGNQAQGAADGGSTNYYIDAYENSALNLPKYSNLGIEVLDDGYMYAYDVWVTPFKLYTFGLWYDHFIHFKWYGNDNLITPDISDGTLLADPTINVTDTRVYLDSISFDNYEALHQIDYILDAVKRPNLYIVPARMDDQIALNINWWYNQNHQQDSGRLYNAPFACSNTYTDRTTIDGGSYDSDVLWEGIMSKYYGQEGDLVSGDIPEKVFETIKVLIRERTYLQSTHCNNSDTPYLQIKETFYDTQNVIDDNWVKDFKGTIKAPFTTFENAFNEHSVDMPLGQMNTPVTEFPENYISSTYNSVYNPEDNQGNYVGSYLSHIPTAHQNSYVAGFGKAFTQATAPERNYVLDTDFTLRYYANCEAYPQMFEIQFKDDGLVHLYDVFFEEPNNNNRPTNQVTFAITYNTNFLTEHNNDFDNYSGYTPYRIMRRSYYYDDGIDDDDYRLSYGRCFVGSSGLGYRDSDFSFGKALPNVEKSDGAYTTSTICRGLHDPNGQDPPIVYTYVMETPYKINGTDQYRRELAFYYPPNDFYPYGHTGTGGQLTQSTITINLQPYNPQVIENPMNKNDNGKVESPNEDENQGEGSDSSNPDDKGSHDNTVVDTPSVPPKKTNVLSSGLLSMYVIDNNNLSRLGGDLFSDNIFQQIQVGVSKPLDCVLRIAESRITPPKESSDRAVKLGSANISARGFRVTKDIKIVDCGSTYVQRRNGDYTDCQEKCQIYLPFIGYRNLDGNFIQNKRVYLVYKFNFLNGKCIANIYVQNPNAKKANERGKALYQTYHGDFMTTFPLGTMSNTGMLSMLMSAGLGAISHNMYSTWGAIRSLPNALVPQAEHTGEFGANNATLINELTPCIHRWKINHTWGEKSGDITGEVSYKRIKISNAKKGYIKCKNFELSTIPNSITKDESEKIKELLNNGVWKV